MKDLIDERNFREKCARSIVKGYNVHYMTPEEIEAMRLAKTSASVEEQKPEIATENVTEIDERWADIPSAGYGQKEEKDPVTKEQIEKILGEREDAFQDVLEKTIGD